MGLCNSTENLSAEDRAKKEEEKKRSKELDRKMQEDNQADQKVNKLLLLGAGESGKSTLFKQMIALYKTDKFDEDYRKGFTRVIYQNVMQSMFILCEYCEKFTGDDLMKDSVECERKDLLMQIRRISDEGKLENPIDKDMKKILEDLWNDPGIQYTYKNRAKFQLQDSTSYFMDKRLDDISEPDYVPTEQDVLRSRVRTTGIVEDTFVIRDTEFRLFDVGGQRNERKKWIHCFEDVTAVIFVAAISEYNQTLYEDETVNRMMESLNLFGEICNNWYFRKTAMILFLNKKDLFEEKIKTVSLKECFGDEFDDNVFKDFDLEDGEEFVKEQYMRRRNPKNTKKLYIHVTTATDKSNMARMFGAVRDTVIQEALEEVGMM